MSATPDSPATSGATGHASRPAADAHGNGEHPPRVEGAPDEATERLIERLLERLVSGAGHLRTLASVSSERARLRLRRARWSLVRMLTLALVGAALAVGGAVYFARGLAGTLAALFGERPWLGELLAGLILLSIVTGGVAIAIARDERDELERLRRKYGDEDGERRGAARAR